VSQYGNWPSVLRVDGSDVMPKPAGDEAVPGPAQVAGANHLRRIALGRVGRPDVQVVTEPRIEEPARKRRKELRQLHVLATLHRFRVAEGVHVGLIDVPLIQVARVAEQTEVDLSFFTVEQQKPPVRHVRRCVLRDFSHLHLRHPADEKHAAAAVRDPDADASKPQVSP
jgi:hypothetical protein